MLRLPSRRYVHRVLEALAAGTFLVARDVDQLGGASWSKGCCKSSLTAKGAMVCWKPLGAVLSALLNLVGVERQNVKNHVSKDAWLHLSLAAPTLQNQGRF